MGYYELMREKTKDERKRQGTGFECWERISREGESLLPSISSSSPFPALISMSTGDFHTAASQLSALTADGGGMCSLGLGICSRELRMSIHFKAALTG